MMTKKYFVYMCLECKQPVLIQLDFLEFNKECCLEFENHKLLKTFNNESEAKNYIKNFTEDEDS